MEKRLVRKADQEKIEKEVNLEAADAALDAIGGAIDELYDSYLNLFKGLNSLYEEYPKLYDAMKMSVKFPNDKDAQTAAEMKVDFDDVRSHYQDEQYLSNILNLHQEDKN
jgi:hypothetical protein